MRAVDLPFAVGIVTIWRFSRVKDGREMQDTPLVV